MSKKRYEKVTLLVQAHCMSCKHSDINAEDNLFCLLDESEVERDYECPQWSIGLHIFDFSCTSIKVVE